MYVLHKLILVLLPLLPRLSSVLLSLQFAAVGGANSSQLCVSLRGRKDRTVTLAKINLAAVPFHTHHNTPTPPRIKATCGVRPGDAKSFNGRPPRRKSPYVALNGCLHKSAAAAGGGGAGNEEARLRCFG